MEQTAVMVKYDHSCILEKLSVFQIELEGDEWGF